jgi:hypothetical protein
MPAPIDLTKHPLEGWEVLRLDKKRSEEKGVRYWRCRCKACGRKKSVQAGLLLSGKSKSCGCLMGRASCRNSPFTKGRAKLAHAEAVVKVIDGREFYAPRKAARYAGVSQLTLSHWSDTAGTGCPLLSGETIEVVLHPTAYNREIRYYAKDDLARVRKARRELIRVPRFAGLVYIGVAAKELGVSMRTLRRLMKAQRPPVHAAKLTARSKDGRPLKRSYIPEAFVNTQKGRLQDSGRADWPTVEEAAKDLGCKTVTIHQYVRRGKLVAIDDYKIVEAMPRADGDPLTYRRKVKRVSAEGVAKIKAERAGRPWRTGPLTKLPGISVATDGPAETMPGANARTVADRQPSDNGQHKRFSSHPVRVDNPPEDPVHSRITNHHEIAESIAARLLAANDDGYVTGKQACEVTGLRPDELSRICQKERRVRFRRPSARRLLVHVADLTRYLCDREEMDT